MNSTNPIPSGLGPFLEKLFAVLISKTNPPACSMIIIEWCGGMGGAAEPTNRVVI